MYREKKTTVAYTKNPNVFLSTSQSQSKYLIVRKVKKKEVKTNLLPSPPFLHFTTIINRSSMVFIHVNNLGLPTLPSPPNTGSNLTPPKLQPPT